jgi:hypothetical protein
MLSEYVLKEMDLDYKQKERVRVIQLGKFVIIEIANKKNNRHWRAYLDEAQFQLLRKKLSKVNKIREMRKKL